MLDHSWKRWVAENKLLNISEQEITAILVRHGIKEQAVKEELQTLKDSPYFQAADSYTQLLHKRQSLAMIERELARLDPKYRTIERRSNVSREEFLEKYYSRNRPVILTDIMKNWQAMNKWTPDYLKATCGDAMVHISAERNENPHYETNDTKHRRNVKFREFIDMVNSGQETNDYYMTARDEFFSNPDVAPLLADIEKFPEYLDPNSNWLFMWYGPKGTYTPLHHDLMNIFMAQVKGRKRIRMIPATQMDLVYNDNGVYTPVDFRNPNYEKFPKFREADVIELELAPGEALFVPAGWWHEVLALDMSITVSLMNFIFPNNYQWTNTKPQREEEKPESQLDASWQGWVKENLGRGCDPVGIVDILRKNHFPFPAIRQAMGANYPEHYIDEASVQKTPDINYKTLAEIPKTRLEWRLGFTSIERPELQLYTLDHFLSDEQCDALLGIIDTNLRPSTITVYIEGYRTSLTCDLSLMNHPLVNEIDQQISAAMGIRLSYSEGLQAQKYETGQEFKAHTDFFEPGTKEYAEHAGGRGNRTWTFMIYLNDVPKGGGTRFTKIDHLIFPKKGTAVIWNNLHPDGTPNHNTTHWGMPVEAGEKYIITKWFREKGMGTMFYEGITAAKE